MKQARTTRYENVALATGARRLRWCARERTLPRLRRDLFARAFRVHHRPSSRSNGSLGCHRAPGVAQLLWCGNTNLGIAPLTRQWRRLCAGRVGKAGQNPGLEGGKSLVNVQISVQSDWVMVSQYMNCRFHEQVNLFPVVGPNARF